MSSKKVHKITDEEKDEEDEVDDEFSECRLDLDVTLGAVLRQSRDPRTVTLWSCPPSVSFPTALQSSNTDLKQTLSRHSRPPITENIYYF